MYFELCILDCSKTMIKKPFSRAESAPPWTGQGYGGKLNRRFSTILTLGKCEPAFEHPGPGVTAGSCTFNKLIIHCLISFVSRFLFCSGNSADLTRVPLRIIVE